MQIRPIHLWVEQALRAGKMSQAELSRRLTVELHREIDRAAVQKMTKGKRDVAADEMLAIEAITGLPVPSSSVAQAIPLLDWVAAGKLTETQSQSNDGEWPTISISDLGPGDFFALRVVGDSMDRISPDGSIIVIDRADRLMVSGKYYVFSVRGETTYKKWHSGEPPYLAAFSTNGMHEPIFFKRSRDFEVIGRVRRTVLDL